jgi:hypothetical protein
LKKEVEARNTEAKRLDEENKAQVEKITKSILESINIEKMQEMLSTIEKEQKVEG